MAEDHRARSVDGLEEKGAVLFRPAGRIAAGEGWPGNRGEYAVVRPSVVPALGGVGALQVPGLIAQIPALDRDILFKSLVSGLPFGRRRQSASAHSGEIEGNLRTDVLHRMIGRRIPAHLFAERRAIESP